MSSIKLLGLGNPLLDIQMPWNEPAVGEAWFKKYQSKYNLEQNGAYLVAALNADYGNRKENSLLPRLKIGTFEILKLLHAHSPTLPRFALRRRKRHDELSRVHRVSLEQERA